jgi:hypothetical protein
MTLGETFMPLRKEQRPASTPLAAGLALALGAVGASPPATAASVSRPVTTWNVSNCADAGAGSLREAVALAASGDTIDLSALACTTLTLSTGAIVVAQDDLTLVGAGIGALTLDGAAADRVLQHTGVGTLHLRALGVARGYATTDGGCVASAGNLDLDHVEVADCAVRNDADQTILHGGGLHAAGNIVLADSRLERCSVYSATGSALGGGAYAAGSLYLLRSTVSGNSATTMAPTGTLLPGGTAYAGAFGGGTESYGELALVDSTVSSNQALAPNNDGRDQANGGGAHVAHDSVMMFGSTVDDNHADHTGGGIMAVHFGASITAITNSTISGNSAGRDAGGLFTQPWLTLANSTVAFNRAGGTRGGGVLTGFDQTTTLSSSIVAGNTAGGDAVDLTLGSHADVAGSHNLIEAGGDEFADTIHAPARLGPLRDNGGETRTHALQSGSPALDAGSSPAALTSDQRGALYARVVGPAADIGAFELDTAETIFSDGFD